MLPSGPRSTYNLPPTPQPSEDAVARQIIATIWDQVARSNSVRTGMMTLGCDGSPVINPLDGSSCNGDGGQKVLFNPQTRTVLATFGRPANGLTKTVTVASGAVSPCTAVNAALKARRRFTDNNGNMYGPDGAWLSMSNPMAQLETDYIHEMQIGTRLKSGDPPTYPSCANILLKKVAGVTRAQSSLVYAPYYPNLNSVMFQGIGQGLTYPSIHDVVWPGCVGVYQGRVDTVGTAYYFDGLDDATFSGTYSGSPARVSIMIVARISMVPTASLNDLTYETVPMNAWADSTQSGVYDVAITATGAHDTFHWRLNGGSWSSGISITGGTRHYYVGSTGMWVTFAASTGHTIGDAWQISCLIGDESLGRPDYVMNVGGSVVGPVTGGWQALSSGISVKFASLYGHKIGDWWIASTAADNIIDRAGVAVRGTVETATACINGGFPNNNVLMTTELNASFSALTTTVEASGSQALVVRDPDTLALLYRKPLDHDATGYSWGDPPEKFCFSTNDEGLFFMQCYTVPALTSPPTPYPGHEFGAPNPRKIAVISVNPITFEPTIVEVITLQDNSYTSGSSFAVASTG